MATLALSRGKASREIDTGLANDLALQAQMVHTVADSILAWAFFSEPHLWRNARWISASAR
jgi:hypothetical protein